MTVNASIVDNNRRRYKELQTVPTLPGTWTLAPKPDPNAPLRYLPIVDKRDIGFFTRLVRLTSAQAIMDPTGKLVRGSRARVVLDRAFTGVGDLWRWHHAVLTAGEEARANLRLAVVDGVGSLVAEYYLHKAWPRKLEVANQPGSDSVTERVMFVCETLYTGADTPDDLLQRTPEGLPVFVDVPRLGGGAAVADAPAAPGTEREAAAGDPAGTDKAS